MRLDHLSGMSEGAKPYQGYNIEETRIVDAD
jgi:hypothetical protein